MAEEKSSSKKNTNTGNDEVLGGMISKPAEVETPEGGLIPQDPAKEVPAEPLTEPTFEVPEKFLVDGKPDLEKILKAQQETEKNFHKATKDLSEAQKLMLQLNETMLKSSQTNAPVAESVKEITDDDFFDNPKETLDRYFKQKFEPLQAKATQNEMDTQTNSFVTRHSDFVDIMKADKGTSLQEWIGDSPYRQKLAAKADKHDWEAADELALGFMELHKAKTTTQQTQETQAEKKAALQDAKTVTGKASADSGKEIITNFEIRELQKTNPKLYKDPGFQKKLMQAYAEGRVRETK